MKKIAALIVGTAAALMFSASPASAQPNTIAGGFACQKWNSNFCAAKGFSVDFGRDIRTSTNTATAIVVDFGWTRFTNEEDDSSIVGGVRETFMRTKKVSVYVQGTAGNMHWKETFPFDDSGNDLLVGGGGAVVFHINDMLDAKVALDFWGARSEGSWDNITRLTVSVAHSFGKK